MQLVLSRRFSHQNSEKAPEKSENSRKVILLLLFTIASLYFLGQIPANYFPLDIEQIINRYSGSI